jgi:hypothetical protein
MKKLSIISIAVTAILLVSTLSLAVNFAAAAQNQGENSNRPTQKTWVRINGVIDSWGEEEVNGLLQTRARTTLLANESKRELTSATAIWTTNDSRQISSVKSKENFTYTFMAARLNDAQVSEFSISDTDYFLNGTWNLYNVTNTVTVITDENNTIVNVLRDSDSQIIQVNGNLTVTDNWTKFTLSLEGQDDLTGSVTRSLTRQTSFNRFAFVDQSATKISRADLAQVATCFRAMPGWGNYDSQMDFNGNFEIDITDLSTVAANL